MKATVLACILLKVGVALGNHELSIDANACGPNEYLAEYPPTCPNDSCDQAIMNSAHCILAPRLVLLPKKTCRCISGYFRINNTGPCVPFSQCPTKPCPLNERLDTCPSPSCVEKQFCPIGPDRKTTCVRPATCPTVPRCKCNFNYRRNPVFGYCIPVTSCRAFKCDGVNEEYAACDQSDDSCESLINSIGPALKTPTECNPRCRCKKGFCRNAATKTCVASSLCVAS